MFWVVRILISAVLIGMLQVQSASGQAIPSFNKEMFVSAVDQCLALNTQSEFDTAADVLARVRTSCVITGNIRLPARAHPILGDILVYEAVHRRFVWNIHLNDQNRFYGGGASPYRLTAQPNGILSSPGNPTEITAVLREVGNANFWLLPLFRTNQISDTYQAGNAFGASRNVIRNRETRYGIAVQVPPGLANLSALEVPIEVAKAREVADHMDIALTFRVREACRICYKANELERGIRPTVHVPTEEEITTRFAYVDIIKIDVIDRRTNEILYTAMPATRP